VGRPGCLREDAPGEPSCPGAPAVCDALARCPAEADRRFLAALVAHMQEAVMTGDGQGRLTSWSPGAERMFGWSAAEAIGQSVFSFLVPPDDAESVRAAIARLEQEDCASYVARRCRKDGGELIAQVNLVKLREGDEARGSFLSVVRDVTAQQIGERALRESEERLVMALAASETEIWEWNVGQGWLHLGPRWGAWLGLPGNGLSVRDVPDLAGFAHPEDRARVEGALREYLARDRDTLVVEARVCGAGGSVRWIQLRGKVVERNSVGGPARLVGTMRDISDRKVLEAQRERLLEAAWTATQRREQLLAVVAHDLRSPLAAVSLACHGLGQLLDGAGLAERGAERLEIIHTSVERMGRLIEDLVDVAAIQAGRLRLTPGPQDPAGIAYEVVRSARAEAQRRGVRLALEDRDAPRVLACDGVRMVQVLGNLVSNALRATPAEGQVALRVTAAGGEVVFSVVDTGRGLPLGDPAALFEPYTRGANADYKGAGLGLAIARGIVTGHGGRIWAERSEGGGAAFHVALPCP